MLFSFYSIFLLFLTSSVFVSVAGDAPGAILTIETPPDNNSSNCVTALDDWIVMTAAVNLNGEHFTNEPYLVNFSSADNLICTVDLTSCGLKQRDRACFCKEESGTSFRVVWTEPARQDLSGLTVDVVLLQSGGMTEITRISTILPHISESIQLRTTADGRELLPSNSTETIITKGTRRIQMAVQGLDPPFNVTCTMLPSLEEKTYVNMAVIEMQVQEHSEIVLYYEEIGFCQRSGTHSFMVEGHGRRSSTEQQNIAVIEAENEDNDQQFSGEQKGIEGKTREMEESGRQTDTERGSDGKDAGIKDDGGQLPTDQQSSGGEESENKDGDTSTEFLLSLKIKENWGPGIGVGIPIGIMISITFKVGWTCFCNKRK